MTPAAAQPPQHVDSSQGTPGGPASRDAATEGRRALSIPQLGRVEAARTLPRAPLTRLDQLRQSVRRELSKRPLSTAGVSLVVWSLADDRSRQSERVSRIWPTAFATAARNGLSPVGAPPATPLQVLAINPNAARVPASNAKLFVTAAAADLLRNRYRFVTELSISPTGGPLYVWGSGDPLFSRVDLARMVKQVKAQGLKRVRGVVVDDGYFGARKLAPGFERFSEASRYRPTSSALNLDGNILRIRISAPRGRRRPRVDVYPASDYVKVRKLIRYGSAKSGRAAQRRAPRVTTESEDTRMWITVSGSFGRRARPYGTQRPVRDPALNLGWALRRALEDGGVEVRGLVWRGRRPKVRRVVAQLERPLDEILVAANTESNNLAAETLVRAIANVGSEDPPRPRGSWQRGLQRIHQHLRQKHGVSDLVLRNGSGLHRSSSVTARATCTLLRAIHADAALRKTLLPTLAVAGHSGTLARRLRKSDTAGQVHGKTGTLAGVLALSGFITPSGRRPLAFSLLVNGSVARRPARRQMDRVVTLLTRYARDLQSPTAEPLLAAPKVNGLAGQPL